MFEVKIYSIGIILKPFRFNQNGVRYVLRNNAFSLYCAQVVFTALASCSDHVWLYIFWISETDAFRCINRLFLEVLLMLENCIFYRRLLLLLRVATGFHLILRYIWPMWSHLKLRTFLLGAQSPNSPAGTIPGYPIFLFIGLADNVKNPYFCSCCVTVLQS